MVNRILSALHQKALFLADMGIASPEEVDLAVTNALGPPMGPFRLMDFTGIALFYRISMDHYQETRDPKDKPSPLNVAKVVKGEWGNKTKKGFYSYE